MADQINIGDIYRATVEFRVGATLTNPTTVTARALSPAGVESALVAVNDGVGLYHADISPTEAGIWRYWFTGTGTAAAVESGSFRVEAVPYTGARYSTPGDVRTLLAEDDTDPDTAAVLTDATLQDAIAQADAEIDAKLGGRYTVPFDPPPLIVARLSGDIAAYLATLTLRHSMAVREEDSIYRRWVRAKELLDLLSSGRAQLPGVADEKTGSTAAVVNHHSTPLWDLGTFGLTDRTI